MPMSPDIMRNPILEIPPTANLLHGLDHHVGPAIGLDRYHAADGVQVLLHAEIVLVHGDALDASTVLHRHDVIARLGAQHVDRYAAGDGDAVDLWRSASRAASKAVMASASSFVATL